MTQMPDRVAEMNRLRWRCTRRSLLEMDILLGGFFDTHYSALTPEQAAAFSVLAEMQDHDLWPLITGRRDCPDALQAQVIAMMRNVRVK